MASHRHFQVTKAIRHLLARESGCGTVSRARLRQRLGRSGLLAFAHTFGCAVHPESGRVARHGRERIKKCRGRELAVRLCVRHSARRP